MPVLTQPLLRPFRPSDVARIVNRDGGSVAIEAILEQATQGPAVTATVEDRPIGCAGMVLPWPGVGMAWMLASEEIGEHGLWLTRTVKAFLFDMVQIHHLHRIEAVAVVDNQVNQAWLEALGFHVEQGGIARAFLADRRSVIRYEWVQED